MAALAVKPKLASRPQEKLNDDRFIAVAHLAADLHKENSAANDETASTRAYITADRMSLAKHFQRWRSRLGTLDQLPFEGNPFVYALNNPLLYIDPTGFASRKGGGGRKRDPFNPSTNDPGSDDPGTGANGILCAMGIGCLDPDLFVCTKWLCTPKCGEPYFKHSPSTEVILTDPDTPCKCVEQKINKDFDKPLPGL